MYYYVCVFLMESTMDGQKIEENFGNLGEMLKNLGKKCGKKKGKHIQLLT